ncbi:9358_t:CDS:2 [Scutellospora calospora]|uniref:9358_t:CDS:1 n=1 Tax=Scutellospora calospora TaxID=85575 RepID=A0ACA9KH90_9GLOM|nr:9358_t:CDS:2 [Scutellospora calospora]
MPKEEQRIQKLSETTDESDNTEVKLEEEEQEVEVETAESSPAIKEQGETEHIKSEDCATEDDDEEEEIVGIQRRSLPRRATKNIFYNRPKEIPIRRLSTRQLREEFKGRDIVFVDPLDLKAKFWWPAMIVPNDEIDETMDVDGKLEVHLLARKFLVRYFEDMTYSVVEAKGLRHFRIDGEPYQSFVKVEGFSVHIGVRRALKCIQKGEPIKAFRWDYWKRPASLEGGENSLSQISVKRHKASVSSTKRIEIPPINMFGEHSNTTSEGNVLNKSRPTKRGSMSSRQASQSTEENTSVSPASGMDIDCETITPTRRNSSFLNDRNSRGIASRRNSVIKNSDEDELSNKKIPKRRRSSASETSDSKRRRNVINENTDKCEEKSARSTSSDKSDSKRRRSVGSDKSDRSDKSYQASNNSRTSRALNRKHNSVSVAESIDQEASTTVTSPISLNGIESTIADEPLEIETETIPLVNSPNEQSEEPIEIMEEEPSFKLNKQEELSISELSDEARDNISRFNFDNPALDKEAKANLFVEGIKELKELWRDYRESKRQMKKIETELRIKKLAELRGTNVLIDDEDDEIGNGCEESDVDYSDYETRVENGHDQEIDEDDDENEVDGDEEEDDYVVDDEEHEVGLEDSPVVTTRSLTRMSNGKRSSILYPI